MYAILQEEKIDTMELIPQGPLPLSVPAHTAPLPVVKLDEEGYIVYANRASFRWLVDLSVSMRKKIPSYCRKLHPCLVDPDAFETIIVESENFITRCHVVGFPEAGYIGLYAVEQQPFDREDPRGPRTVQGMLAD